MGFKLQQKVVIKNFIPINRDVFEIQKVIGTINQKTWSWLFLMCVTVICLATTNKLLHPKRLVVFY